MSSKFLHEEIYRGENLVKLLAKHHITVCGAGALGSNLVDSLCRQGFSNVTVIDFDRVESHNISTQLYGDVDVGAFKTDALKNKIFSHVGTEIVTHGKELKDGTAKKFLKDATLIVDTFDNSKSRKLVQDWARKLKTPCLHAGLFEDYGEVVWDDVYQVPGDAEGDVCEYPLARNLITIIVGMTSEEILDFCLAKKPRQGSWSFTLKDFKIGPYR